MTEPITDTTPDVEARFQRLLMQRSGEERIRMACDMFQAARRLMLAALPASIADDPTERRIALLVRMYHGDLDQAFLAKVQEELRRRASEQNR